MTGIYAVIEGPDYSGKTTQIKHVAHLLRNRGHTVREVREPGGTAIGDHIRLIFKAPAYKGVIDPLTSLFLVNAARRQLLTEVIKPAIQRGEIVIADRNWISTIVYQGYLEGCNMLAVRKTCELAMGGLVANATFVLSISLEELLRRRTQDAHAPDRYDGESETFCRKLCEQYEAITNDMGLIKINGERPEAEITEDLARRIERLRK